jgi:translocation and assembly module TamB
MANLHRDIENQNDPNESRPKRSQRVLRLFAWMAGCLLVSFLICSATLSYLVNTSAGHRYLLDLAQRKATEALGVEVKLENFTLHPTTLNLDLYGVRVSGAAPHPNPPVLTADHIEVGLRIVSILQAKWYFDNIRINHPVAWVVVDRNGQSNLPVFKSSRSSQGDIFDLGIRHFQIELGEVYYNSRPSAIAADLDDLQFQSTFNSLLTKYSGTLAYANGKLAFGTYRPLDHNLKLDFEATRQLFTLKRASFTAGASQVVISATLRNYSNPEIHAQYQIAIDGKQTAQILNEPTLPAGLLKASGTLAYQQSPNRSAIESLTIHGDLSSARLFVDTASARLGIANLAAHYSLVDSNAALHDLRADVLGGVIAAEGTVEQIGGNTRSSFHVGLQNVSLAQARQAFARSISTNGISLNGTASATATAEWGKTIDDMIAHADLTLDGKAVRPDPQLHAAAQRSAASSLPPNGASIPFQGAVHAIYTRANGNLTLNDSHLQGSQAKVTLNGTVSRSSSLSVNIQANDLGEVATFADLFRAPTAGAPNLNLGGRASFQGAVRGSVDAPEVTGQLTAENLEYNGTEWKLLHTRIALSPAHAKLENLRLQGAHRGQVTATADIGLQRWSPSSQSPLHLDLNISDLSMETLAVLTRQQLPVSGTLSVAAHLRGEIENPSGHANATLTGAAVSGEPVSRASVDLTGSGNQVQVSASVELPAGTVQARATADPRARTFTAQLQSRGIDLAKLQTVKARGIDAQGTVQLHAHGQGSFDNPAIDANLLIPNLTIASQTISQTNLQLNAANRVANLEFSTSVASAPLHGKAQVNLTGDYLADASFDSETFALAPILAAFAPDEASALSGQAEIHATIHGPLKDWHHLEAHLKLPVLKVAYNNAVQLAASPIQADYQNSMVTLQPVTIRGTDTELNVQGSFPVGTVASASLKAQGSVNMQLMQIFDPDLRASGQLKLNIDSRGALGSNLFGGEVEIAGANLSTNTSPVGLTNANGVLKLTSDRLEITKLSGTVGGGQIDAQGAIVLRPKIQFDLGATAKGAKLLYPQGVRESVNANLRLTGSIDQALLSGSVNLADISFTPAFDLAAAVNQFSGGVEAPPTRGFAQNLNLNISVNSSSNANLVSRTLSLAGSANLQVRGTAAEPVILGRVSLSSGDVILNGNRFVLTGGTIQFINPAMTQPVLNVSLTTTIQEYKIDLRFQGPSDQMRTQYTSDPSLPPADIINLLAFGQTTEASAANSTPMNQQAEGLVASQVSSQVTSRVSKAAGISQLSISPVLAGGTAAGPPGANITIQQRVTGNLFVTFSTNVATTQGQTIQGQYQVSPRVAISATRDPNGGFAVDTIIKKSW